MTQPMDPNPRGPAHQVNNPSNRFLTEVGHDLGRRDFLRISMAAGLGSIFFCNLARALPDSGDKKFRGIFPIVQTPYTESNRVDFATLQKEVEFLDRAGVHGIVWPQRASQYNHLSFEERIEGAEVIVSASKGLKPVVVIGVQGPDTATAIKYAKHAEKLQPDAIIALPERDRVKLDLDQVARYYAAIAKACSLPLFVQTTGNMSVEFVVKMAREIPTLRFIKDEAGHTLSRIGEFRRAGADLGLSVFTGSHGRTLIDEMIRGVAGNMPAAGWVDLYVKVWDSWHAGKQTEALATFSKIMLFVTQSMAYGIPALHYILHLRGVFPNGKVRGTDYPPLDPPAKQSLEKTFEFVKPYFTG